MKKSIYIVTAVTIASTTFSLASTRYGNFDRGPGPGEGPEAGNLLRAYPSEHSKRLQSQKREALREKKRVLQEKINSALHQLTALYDRYENDKINADDNYAIIDVKKYEAEAELAKASKEEQKAKANNLKKAQEKHEGASKNVMIAAERLRSAESFLERAQELESSLRDASDLRTLDRIEIGRTRILKEARLPDPYYASNEEEFVYQRDPA